MAERAIARRADWHQRLTSYLAGLSGQRFRWGRLDCALFAAGAVEAMTGTDLARGWRGYRTEAEGRRKLAEKGFASHVDLVADKLPRVARPRPGDVVVIDGVAIGIFQGRQAYVMSPVGLGLVASDRITASFRI